jgi:hypothetical protein
MKTRRFFRTVWRLNALIILIAGVLACGLLAFVMLQFLRDMTRTRHVSNVVNVAPEQRGRDRTSLGSFTRVEGTQVFRAPLNIEQTYELSVASKETTSIQNYLFYDPALDRSYWLRAGAPALFVGSHELPERDFEERLPITAMLYEIVERDTDGDQRLTESDLRVIAVADAAGTRLTPVLRDVAQLHAADITTGNAALVIYTTAGKLHAATVDVVTRKVTHDSLIQP